MQELYNSFYKKIVIFNIKFCIFNYKSFFRIGAI